MTVEWETWNGKKYQGKVIEQDSNDFIVRLEDGTTMAVDSNKCRVVD